MPSSRKARGSSSSSPKYYAIFLAKFSISLNDPDIPGTRYHHVIFVETDPIQGSGIKFHVIGDITRHQGMTYESRGYHNPSNSTTCVAKEPLGYTAADGFQRRWDRLLSALPTPPKQKAYNIATHKTELVKCWDPLQFYEPGEERHVPWKCTEWTNEYAIPALWEAKEIVEEIPTDPSSQNWEWDEDYQRYRMWDSEQDEWIWAPEE
ncbi:hypothetical protein PspLS_11480 [Pyricularia sp. CBS 133598]|nr:hypothetical protein PspLS_11480 [Pyricularia sp. CBS 133598]